MAQRTIERAMASLKSKGLILTANYNKMKADRTLWYSIDYDILETLEVHNKNTSKPNENSSRQNGGMVTSNCRDHNDNLGVPIPETSSETTTKRSNQSVSQSDDTIPREKKEEKTKDRLTDSITIEKEVKEIIINAQVELYDSKNFLESVIRKLYTDSNLPYNLKMGLTHNEIKERLKILTHMHIDRGLFKLGEAQKSKGVKNIELYFAKCLLTSIVEAQIDFLGLEENE